MSLHRLSLVALLAGLWVGPWVGLAGASEATFTSICATCHGPGGAGVPGLAPALTGTLKPHLKSAKAREYFAQLPISGLIGPITVDGQMYNLAMPSQSQLKDEELAAAINYVLQTLNGAAAPVVAPEDIAAARTRNPGPGDTFKLRRAVLQGG
jgi:mono/diheme cytochrome c family protein